MPIITTSEAAVMWRKDNSQGLLGPRVPVLAPLLNSAGLIPLEMRLLVWKPNAVSSFQLDHLISETRFQRPFSIAPEL